MAKNVEGISSIAGVIDLFCGIGGMTHGFKKAGFRVVAGIDNDSSCKYGYEANNDATFIDKDIAKVSAASIKKLFGKSKIKILIGCAPCQPFSKLNPGEIDEDDQVPLRKFAELITKVKPDIVSMENVRGLADRKKYPVFQDFLNVLKKNKYWTSYRIVDCSEYGIPQKRLRLVLLASRFGPIELIPVTHLDKKVTVREVIGSLPSIEDGDEHKSDPLHKARKLSEMNKKRILATPLNGGSAKDWNDELVLKCHKKKKGRSYKSTVYGRMSWDEPAPTMTTQCVGLGNGRFGHPEQHRAISLREAALIQTFPEGYSFISPESEVVVSQVARFIGNAVPVRLGEIIATSIKKHLENLKKTGR